MRYVAVTRLNLQAPVHIAGVGETMAEAQRGAFDWFSKAIDRGIVRGTHELIALQNRLAIMTEQDLLEQSGVGLEEWLARSAARGDAPGSTEEKAPAPLEPVVIKENRLINGMKDLALMVAMLIALPLGLNAWQLLRSDILDYIEPAGFVLLLVALAVVMFIFNLIRYGIAKMAFGLGLREYVVIMLVIQSVLRVLWEMTDDNVWLGLVAIFFV